jgi:hypothetical protein
MHEAGVKVLERFFDNAMQAQQDGQEENMEWVYGTNSTHCIRLRREDGDGRWSPTGDEITPDGSIYDPEDLLTLVIEVASSQAMSAAREQIKKAMQMGTVVGGIILDLSEYPPYRKPKAGEWQLGEDNVFLLSSDLGRPPSRWGPWTIQGFQFGGRIEGSLKVIQRGKASTCVVSNATGYCPAEF